MLGLPLQPTHAELKKAYRALALQLHPDKQPPDATETQRQEAVLKFREVQEAHDTLVRLFGWGKGAKGGDGGGPAGDEGSEEAAKNEAHEETANDE